MKRLAHRLLTVLGLPWGEKLLALELAVELARARFEVSWLPFRWYASGLGRLHPSMEEAPVTGPDPLAIRVGVLTSSLAAALPWRSTCLVRAMAALRVLRRRGRATALFLGVRTGRGMEAHAWLRCGGRTVTGRAEMGDYTPVALFAGPS